MNSVTLKYVFSSIIISLIPFSLSFLPIEKASAQITPDSTLGNESSVVNQLNQLKSLIEGGAVRGENLFHSFLEFNVGNGQTVYFVNPDGVNNILTRVTGNNISQILGTLGINGNANLFLINPNGFIFGNGAKLDLNGSFTATTGDIQLGEDGVFSATDTQGSSLLSVQPQAVFANFQGQIENRANLVVRDGEKIILMADKVVNTGNLTAPVGMIKLEGNEVNISENSVIDVSGNEGAGAIALQGTEEVNIGENVSLTADALVSGDGGVIEISSQGKVEFLGNLSAKGENSGTVTIDAPTVINNGVIDLGAESSEEEKVSDTEAEKTIASNPDTEEEKTIASDTDAENESPIASNSPTEAEKTIASNSNTEAEKTIVSNSNTEAEKTIASNSNTEAEKTIASNSETDNESPLTPLIKEGTDTASPQVSSLSRGTEGESDIAALTANNPRLQPDESLGNENTQIETIDENNDRVIGGAERGVNLFHSFGEFNIETDKGVYFANPVGIDNILARVTGENISEIRGTLGVEGNADLYFINPNGLFFNQNASLDLNGSFFASTAEAIAFSNFDYSAVNPNIPPIIDVGANGISPPNGNTPNPTGLRFAANSGDITNQGRLITSKDLTLSAENLNLSSIIATEGNLTLKAHDTVTMRDSNENPFIAASGADLLIQGNAIDIFVLNHPDSGLFAGGNLTLKSPNQVIGDAHYWSGGNFSIEDLEGNNGDFNSIEDPIIRAAGDVSFSNYQGTSLHIIAGGSVTANTITIDSVDVGVEGVDFIKETVTLSDGTVVDIDGSQQPTVDIRAGVSQQFIGTPDITGLGISDLLSPLPDVNQPATSADINVDYILIDADNGLVLLSNQYQPNLNLSGGEINITAENASVGGIDVQGNSGDGGNVYLDSRDSVYLGGDNSQGNAINTRSNFRDAGSIKINAQGDLNLRGKIRADSFAVGEGNAGDVSIKSGGDITLNENPTNGLNSLITTNIGSSTEGKLGNIEIKAKSITLNNNSQLQSGFFSGGKGEKGLISLDAENSVTLNESIFFADAEVGAIGNASDIKITAKSIFLNSSFLKASNAGFGNAGNIFIHAEDLVNIDDTFIRSNIGTIGGTPPEDGVTSIGNIGKIEIQAKSISLTNNSEIQAGFWGGGQGEGGLVSLKAFETIDIDGNSAIFANSDANSISNASDINLTAPSVTINSARVIASNGGRGNAGNIIIDTSTLTLTNGTIILTGNFGEGNAGAIEITATDSVTISGEDSDGDPSRIISGVLGMGDSGRISIDTSTLTLTNGALIEANTFGKGNAGAIEITATDSVTISGESTQGARSYIASQVGDTGVGNSGGISIDTSTFTLTNGAEIDASTFGKGNAGAIQITARDSVTISGESTQGARSNIASQVTSTGEGNSGGLSIDTSSLTLTNGAFIDASTFGKGNAGAIEITARDSVTISGESIQGARSNFSSQVGDTGVGNSGGILIDTSSLTLTNGAFIDASTFGKGNAGAIEITATDSVTISGESTQGARSYIASQVTSTGEGNSGGIVIETSNFTLNDGAFIDASTFGKGNAGAIEITARDSVTISGESIQGDRSNFSSQVGDTGVGNSGGIVIETSNFTLNDGAFMTTSTSGEGNAGAIQITASDSVTISGESTQGLGSFISSQVRSKGVGNSGGIVIETSNFTLNDGAFMTTSTDGEGDAGVIQIKANDSVSLSGESTQGSGSFIASQVGDTGVGDSEGIVIDTSIFTLSEGAGINASTSGKGNAGAIQITATDSVTLLGESSNGSASNIASGVFGMGDSEGIIIDTSTLTLSDGASIDASTAGEGNAGAIQITASYSVSLSGESRGGLASSISSFVGKTAVGNSGGIVIDTSNLTLSDGAFISASSLGKGNAGAIHINATDSVNISGEDSDGSVSNINSFLSETGVGDSGGIVINTSNFTLTNGALIDASTFGKGNAGAIEITARDSVTISGEDSQGDRSQIISQVRDTAVGDSGGISIDTSTLTLTNGAFISASTFGQGNAGQITINASKGITINGQNSQGVAGGIFTTVSETGVGDSQGIEIDTTTLTLENGNVISAITRGNGDAGNINIMATEQISISGTSFNEAVNRDLGGLLTFTSTTGKAGNTTIDTSQLTISEGAGIEAFTSGEGNAGNIIINATESIILNADTKLIVETSNLGTAGDINIDTPLLTIGENAQLSATATETSTAETAGNINLNVNQLNIAGELGIFAETQSIADAGSLTIQPYGIDRQDAYPINPNLNIQFTDEGFISARTTNIGDGGSITITSPESIDIRGNGSITAETSGNGNAGNIDIDTQNLTIADQVTITTSTESSGNAGKITLNATESIFLTNEVKITSEVREGATGTSEGIIINTPILSISDRSQISAATEGEKKAGDITIIDSKEISLNNNSEITALTTGSGKAGNIDLTVEKEINIDSGSILNVETQGIGDAGKINISADRISIGENAELSARTTENARGKAGNITLKTNELNISGQLGIFAETEGIAPAGNLIINSNNNPTLDINFTKEGQISASTSGSGKGGDINITAPEIINILGDGTIKVETSDSGDAGNILIDSNEINLTEGIEISASTSKLGDSGGITLEGNLINLDDATIKALTTGEGNPGSILISNGENNANQVNLTNSTISTEIQADGEVGIPANITINSDNLALDASKITASTSANRDAGKININTTDFNLNNNSIIQTNTSSFGKAGDIIVNVSDEIKLNNSEISAKTTGEGTAGSININQNQDAVDDINLKAGKITVEATGTGNSGSIQINANNLTANNESIISASVVDGETTNNQINNIDLTANNLSLENGSQISSSTSGSRQAGNIKLNIAENLILSGTNTGIFARTEANSTGDGGSINIDPELVLIEDGAAIAVNSQGKGQGGNIKISTNLLKLNNSEINAETFSTNGGNINLIIKELLLLENSSNITATAGITSSGGDGGNIEINSPWIISNPSNPFNTITANAFEGKGGNIEITTNAIFGGEFLIIDASSQLGLDGEVIINDPDVDPTSGLIIIDANFIDAEGLIAQNPCAVENFQIAGGSSFVVIGKGGLPTQSADLLNNNLILTPWFELTPEMPDSSYLEGEVNLSAEKEQKSLFSAIYCRGKN